MTQIWQQIRLGRHVGFEEGKLLSAHSTLGGSELTWSSLAIDCRSIGLQTFIVWFQIGGAAGDKLVESV